MELIQTIVLLCQVTAGTNNSVRKDLHLEVQKWQTQCQQSYLNCVLKRNTWERSRALEQCILEK